MSKSNTSFWITNISDHDVNLSDLGITICARKTVNLLNQRYYSFKIDELVLSATSGSLFIKQSKIRKRLIPPTKLTPNHSVPETIYMPTRQRSVNRVEEVHYEELDISDDIFAEQASDFADENYSKK